jgi:Bifunctional DNA primase/polymerase, N-terminal
MSSEACRIAINLARNAGYAVFPMRLTPAGKKVPTRPKDEGGEGYKDASKEPGRIAWLWNHWPGPLIGVATGAVSGIDVLDIDCARHPEAAAWYQAAKPRLPLTRIFKSHSGGDHLYFLHANGVKCSSNKLAYGTDIRGEGGCCTFWFAAGCDCIDHSPPTPWPDWLLELVLWEPPPPPEPKRTHKPKGFERAIDGLLRHVSSAREGERNSALHWGACRMRERILAGQIGTGEAASLLVAAARASGLTEIEARATVRSAFRAR